MLDTKIADEIVKETSLRLNRNINIMNTKGIIISSINKNRLGTIHQGAIEVLKSEEKLSIYSGEKWEGTQPGINLPINFMGHIIGVIGITGKPDEIENIGELVKMTTELMIKQNYMERQTEWKYHTREVLIDQLLKKKPAVSVIEENKNLLGLRMTPPFTSLLIKLSKKQVSNRKIIDYVEKQTDSSQTIIGFINLNELIITIGGSFEQKISSIYNLFKSLDLNFRMATSLPFNELTHFDQAYNECEIALQISEPNLDFVSFSMLEAKSLLYQIDNTITKNFSDRIIGNLSVEQIITLESFFTNHLNIQKTSEVSYIHRNTLIYRLRRIEELTGYNPKVFEEALVLQIAIWIYRKPYSYNRRL